MELDTTNWTRMREVERYATAHGVPVSDAIRMLVNHALSTPDPTRESWKASVNAGADALAEDFPTLRHDFTRKGLRKLAKTVLLAS